MIRGKRIQTNWVHTGTLNVLTVRTPLTIKHELFANSPRGREQRNQPQLKVAMEK